MPELDTIAAAQAERRSCDHNTPDSVLALLRRVAPLGLDPCGNPWSLVRPRVELSAHRGDDGLTAPWHAHVLPREQAFVNPPYDRGSIPRWMTKILREVPLFRGIGASITCLVPADTSTAAFRTGWNTANAMCLWDERIQFIGSRGNSNPWSSVIWYWGDKPHRFCHFLESRGIVQVLRGGA